MDNKALFKISYGLFLLSSEYNGRDNACIINSAIQTTSNPAKLLISVNKSNFTTELIEKSGRFALTVLSEKAGFETFKQFGFQSGRDADKTAGTNLIYTDSGLPYLKDGACAFFECEVTDRLDSDTHMIFVARILEAEVLSPDAPMTYDFYHKNVKPKPQKTDAQVKGWRCKVCGYVYEGENLPPDFICPICKHGAQDFEKIE